MVDSSQEIVTLWAVCCRYQAWNADGKMRSKSVGGVQRRKGVVLVVFRAGAGETVFLRLSQIAHWFDWLCVENSNSVLGQWSNFIHACAFCLDLDQSLRLLQQLVCQNSIGSGVAVTRVLGYSVPFVDFVLFSCWLFLHTFSILFSLGFFLSVKDCCYCVWVHGIVSCLWWMGCEQFVEDGMWTD